LLYEDEPIITYLDTSTLPAREELFQLTASGIGSEDEIEDPTPFTLQSKKIILMMTHQRPKPAT
jgi:hypothetical protein